ncbi:MAG: hypothetical protein ACKVXR_06555 [Planctomycetota bacterium]
MLRIHCNPPGFTALTALVLALPATGVRAAPAAPDTLSPGFVPHAARPVGAFDAYATLPNSDRIVSDGTTVWREADDGTVLLVLGTFPAPVFASFVLPDPTSTFALVGESSNGEIYRVELAGGGFNFLCDLDYNFDARFEDAGHVLVSAATCGFMCGNEIHRVDLANGGTTLVAVVSGPSGPLARAANGDLYYGVNPDWPATTGSIIRWSAAQVSSGTLLTEAAAAILASGIDPASSMELEPVFGNLFVTQPVFGNTSHVREYTPDGQLRGIVAASPEYLSGVEFLRTTGIGSFQAFQPAGVRLLYRATDYSANTSAVRSVRPRRPRASTSGPGLTGPGIVTIQVKDALPNASISLLMGATAHYDANEATYDRGYFLFHTGMPLTGIRPLGTVTTDSNGDGSFQWVNRGGLQGTRVFQALIRDATGRLIGSSTAAFN